MNGTDGADPAPLYQLLLLVAGSTLRSRRAIENLRRICEEQLAGKVDLQIVDIYQRPELAAKYQVVAAPTLLKLLPLPVRHIIGDLSAQDRVMEGLDLDLPPAEGGRGA
jgi:circadian clock protein KaiB